MECNGHDHDYDTEDSLGNNLRQYMDVDRIRCLNENVPGSGRAVVSKFHNERLTDTPVVTSPPDDPELLFLIPFTEAVAIKSVTIRNSSNLPETASARTLKLFVNRSDLDFDLARDDLPPQQVIELVPEEHFPEGTVDYPCRPAGRFQSVTELGVFVPDNFANDDVDEIATAITYLGCKGKGTAFRCKVVDTVYESRGMPTDHKVPEDGFAGRSIL